MRKVLLKASAFFIALLILIPNYKCSASINANNIYVNSRRDDYDSAFYKPSTQRTMVTVDQVCNKLNLQKDYIIREGKPYTRISNEDIEIVVDMNTLYLTYLKKDICEEGYGGSTFLCEFRDGKLYVPIRFITEKLGYKVSWSRPYEVDMYNIDMYPSYRYSRSISIENIIINYYDKVSYSDKVRVRYHISGVTKLKNKNNNDYVVNFQFKCYNEDGDLIYYTFEAKKVPKEFDYSSEIKVPEDTEYIEVCPIKILYEQDNNIWGEQEY